MSMNRVCPMCFQEERFRYFFVDNESEAEFHRDNRWCSCGYESPEEMMQDQDLGFTDYRWVLIIRSFLNEYYLRLSQGVILNKDEHVRFFLKLLKFSANDYRLSIELTPPKKNELLEYIVDGVPKKQPHSNIFDDAFELKHLPKQVVLDVLNTKIHNSYTQSLQEIKKLKRIGIIKNLIIGGLLAGLIYIGIFLIKNTSIF